MFADYSWRGYGSYSQLQDEVLQDVTVEKQSVYHMVLRYMNPNPTPIVGEVRMEPKDASNGEPIAQEVLLQPTTDGQPSFFTVLVSGVYEFPFDLKPGEYVTAVKIPNSDPNAKEVLVDYFVLIPQEYYEPRILKQDVYAPCLAGQTLPYCRHYSYPDLAAFPKTYGNFIRKI